MNKIPYIRTLISVLAIGLVAPCLQANIISVNIGADNDNSRVLTDYGVGELGTVAGNWNNIGFDFANLLYGDGTESTVLVETNFPWGTNNDQTGFPRSYGLGFIGTPLNHGPNCFPATPGPVSLVFSNLRANFPDGYYVIAYVTGFRSVLDSNPQNFTEGIVSDGRTNFYYSVLSDTTTPFPMENLTATTVSADPGSGNYPVAQYAVFGSKELPKNADVYEITISSNNRGVSLGGVQIVSATYEGGGGGPTMWAGFDVRDGGIVEGLDGFLGWMVREGTSDWWYSTSGQQYVYVQENYVTRGAGSFMYVFDQALFSPIDIAGGWFFSESLNTWIASYSETAGTGAGWLYILDLSD
jgi:hypothetical protein